MLSAESGANADEACNGQEPTLNAHIRFGNQPMSGIDGVALADLPTASAPRRLLYAVAPDFGQQDKLRG